MPLMLRPLTTADTLSWTRVRALAYMGPTHLVVHSAPPSEDTFQRVAEDRKREIGKPNTWHWKVVDTDLSLSPDDPEDNGGRTIAIAVWSAHNINVQGEEDGSNEPASVSVEKSEAEHQPFLPPELRLDVLNALFTPIRAAQDEIMGSKQYLILNTLATHPDHHRKGAGTILLQWGLQKADELNLEMYLDSTTIARPLYEKHGFEVKKMIEFDRVPWGGEGVDRHWCMVRKAKPVSSTTA